MRQLIGFLILIIISQKVIGGWFECYNYTGVLNKQKIDLSIQFLGKNKERVEGIYKFYRINNPIQLVGEEQKGDTLKLKELINDSITGKLRLFMKGDSLIGKWISVDGKTQYQIYLKMISKLIDTLYKSSFTNVDLLLRQSTKNYYFVGSYSLQKDEYRACMDCLKVIEKKSNKVLYKIDFSKSELFNRRVGNIMTIIYNNLVSVSVDNKDNLKQIILTADLGRMGCDFPIYFNAKNGDFIINENELNYYAPPTTPTNEDVLY